MDSLEVGLQPVANFSAASPSSHTQQEGKSRGRFRRIVWLIQLVLRAFSVSKRIAIHPTWNK
jgi:hypothetical protein